MSRICVEFNGLRQLDGSLDAAAAQASIIRTELLKVSDHLDWEVWFQSNVVSAINLSAKQLEKYGQTLESHQTFLNGARCQYEAPGSWDAADFGKGIASETSIFEPLLDSERKLRILASDL